MSMVSPVSERMLPFALTVNGRAIAARAEPRTHLADFLREGLGLTGTHLGCEHGVCGACTILIDGEPARACLTFAVAADGSAIRTIEGLDDDEITTELRAAFTREHALQCGYCTPAMLITARDLVIRLPDADERHIRLGLAGNLCRCTGYVGIVRAVRSVIAERRARGVAPRAGTEGRSCGPVGAALASATEMDLATRRFNVAPAAAARVAIPVPIAVSISADFTPANSFDHAFTVAYLPDDVFALFGRIEEVATCLPGASVTLFRPPGTVEGLIRTKVGPIVAIFRGAAQIERNSADRSGSILAAGIDTSGRSTTQAIIRYRVMDGTSEKTTRVELTVGYTLKGPLAQFGRPALVRNVAERIIAAFVANLKARLAGEPLPAPARNLDLFSLLIGQLRTTIGGWLSGRTRRREPIVGRTSDKRPESNDGGALYAVEPVAKNGKDGWLLVGAPVIGALLYFVVRWIFA
jgi:carbon-monoxide dehydrogenase small subunit